MNEWSKLADTLSVMLVIAIVAFLMWVLGTLLLTRDESVCKEVARHEKKIKQRLKRWEQIRKERNEQRT